MAACLATHRTHHVSISNGKVDQDWDHFVENHPSGHHAQTSLWGNLKSDRGSNVARVTIHNGNGDMIAGAQLLFRPLPLGTSVAYVAKGPVLAPHVADDPELLGLVIDEIHRLARDEGAQCLVVQPPDDGFKIAGTLSRQGFHESQLIVQPTATTRVDLTPDLDTILSRAKKKTRQLIRRSLRENLTFREGGREDIPTFYELFEHTAERHGFPPFPEEYFTRMWNLFGERGQMKLFFCDVEGEPIRGQIVLLFRDTVIGKHNGWSGEHAKKSPNQFLDWKIIEWAKEQGYRYYDQDGIEYDIARTVLEGGRVDSRSESESQSYYKLSYGGEVLLFPLAYYHVFNPVLRAGYRLVADHLTTSRRFLSSLERLRAG